MCDMLMAYFTCKFGGIITQKKEKELKTISQNWEKLKSMVSNYLWQNLVSLGISPCCQ